MIRKGKEMDNKRKVLSKLLWLSLFAISIVITSWISAKNAEAACSHSYRWVTKKQPTCKETGYQNYTCSKCGHVKNSQTLAKVPSHSWDRSSATCTAAKKCKICGTVGQKATGHSYSWVTMKQPTCKETGYQNYTCSKCGHVSSSQTLAKVPSHSWDRSSATCTSDKKCTICGTVGQKSNGQHSYNSNGKCTWCGVPQMCTVTVHMSSTTKSYKVQKGGKFTFPSDVGEIDGMQFIGWVQEVEGQSIQTRMLPGDQIVVNSNVTYSPRYMSLYKKIGTVYDPDSKQNYEVWMIEYDSTNIRQLFASRHSGNIVTIARYANLKGYTILDSWIHRDETFKRGVCTLIVDYNKSIHNEANWDRTVTGCVDEWIEHNVLYALGMDGNLLSKVKKDVAADWEEQGADVDLDSAGDGYVPAVVYEAIKASLIKFKSNLTELFS